MARRQRSIRAMRSKLRTNSTTSIQATSKFRWPITLLLLAVGMVICFVLVTELGSARLQQSLWFLAPYVPLLMLIEGGRFVAELISARVILLRAGDTGVSWALLMRAQCVAHACNKVMPAGRATGEALKAAILAPTAGAAKAVGLGAAAQIMTLLVNGAIALVAGAVAWLWFGVMREAIALGVYGLMGTMLGIAVVISLQHPRLLTWLQRLPAMASMEHHAHDLLQCGVRFGGWAIFWHAAAKAAQTLQLVVLLYALGRGISPGLSLIAEGIQIVGAAAGDLLPAQLGATEGAFTLTASSLGISASAGLSLALVLHGVQLLFAAATFVAAIVVRMAQVRPATREFEELHAEYSGSKP